MTVREVAEYLRKSPLTIYKYVQLQKIPVVRRGHSLLFDLDEINTWVDQQKRGMHKVYGGQAHVNVASVAAR